MSKGSELFLDKVLHKAKIDVDEEGAEASASTVGIIEANSIQIPMTFIADHPFLFFILDKEHGHILFMGRVADPTKANP